MKGPLGQKRKLRLRVTQTSMWDVNPGLCDLSPLLPTTGWLVSLWEDIVRASGPA